MKNEYLNEKNIKKTKKVLITIGCISLCIGLTLFIISFILKEPAMGQEGAFEVQSAKVYLRAGAFILCVMIPIPVFISAFESNIMAYQIQQMMPVAKEGMKEMAPVYGEIAKGIAKGVKEEIDEGKSGDENEQ